MFKLRYLGLIAGLALVLLPSVLQAAYNTVTHASSVTINLSGKSLDLTLASTSELESYSVDADTVTFVVSSGSLFNLSYAGKLKFVASSHGCTETNVECNSNSSYVDLNCPSVSGTQTITVTTLLCGASGTTGGGGGGSVLADTTAPVISNISATAEKAQAVVSWNTNESSISWVVYGLTTAYGSESKNASYLTSHSRTLTDLAPGKTYHYQIKSKDSAGNIGYSSDKTFTTTGTATAPETTAPTTGGIACSLTVGGAYKTANSSAVYYVTENCEKRAFSRADVFKTYFTSWNDVKTVTKEKLDGLKNDTLGFMPWGPKYDPKYGALVKIVTDPKTYLLLGTKKYWITDETVFNKLGYKWTWIEDIDKALLDKYTTGSEISYLDHHPNYTLVKYAGSAKVYRLEPDPTDASKQVKRWIPDEKTYNQLNFRWDRILTLPATEVYTDGAQLTQ